MVYVPKIEAVIEKLEQLSKQWETIAMLAKTHGQPASPTRLGKEFAVFVDRIKQQIKPLKNTPIAAKFGGATGNFNAHKVAYPTIDWKAFGTHFVENILGVSLPVNSNQIQKLSKGLTISSKKAKDILGYEPKETLDEDILQEVRWLKLAQ